MEFVGTSRRRVVKQVSPLENLLLTQELSSVSFMFRLFLWIIFSYMGVRFLFTSLSPALMNSFWHNVNLPFHEAGHILFGFLPPLGASFMGTGMQLLIPLICCIVLLIKTGDRFGASIAFWWFGQNWLDIAPYIADARSGTLPLLGGNTGQSSPYGFHDWEFILGELRLLSQDQAIAATVFIIGKIILIVSLIWGAVILYRSFQNRSW